MSLREGVREVGTDRESHSERKRERELETERERNRVREEGSEEKSETGKAMFRSSVLELEILSLVFKPMFYYCVKLCKGI